MRDSFLDEIDPKQRAILRFAKSKGFLSPVWLLSDPSARRIKQAFEDLETFLREAFLEGDIPDVGLEDIESFIWNLKRSFAFDGWEGIAPFLLTIGKLQQKSRREPSTNL